VSGRGFVFGFGSFETVII